MDTKPAQNKNYAENAGMNGTTSQETPICPVTGLPCAPTDNVVHCGKLVLQTRDFSEIPDWVMAGG